MLGALTGDWCGSSMEWRAPPWRQNDAPWRDESVRRHSRFTDDSVLTVATADVLLNLHGREVTAEDFARSYKVWGRRYPDAGYGSGFYQWLADEELTQRFSWANGAAMRVSPVAWVAPSLDTAVELARRSARITHGHPEALKGTAALAGAVWLLRHNVSNETLKNWIETQWGYNVQHPLESLWQLEHHDCACSSTVPQAMIAFFSASSFEEALMAALSIGGDSDTIGAMTGALAEARWVVSAELDQMVRPLIPEPMLDVLHRFEAAFGVGNSLPIQEDCR